MKICIVQGPFLPIPPINGGAVEKMWFELANYFNKKGHKITYISRHFKKFRYFEKKNKIIHLRVKSFNKPKNIFLSKYYDFIYTLRVLKKIPDESDIIISNTFFLPILINNNLKKKIFIDVQRTPRGQIFFYKKSARFRANSKIVYNNIIKELGNTNKHKVRLIPNPLTNISKSLILKKFNNKILYTGRIHPEKGLEILINAFKKLNDKSKLEIIGPYKINEGGGGLDYLNKLKYMSKKNNIRFLGPIYDKKKLNLKYKNASIFIYPSISEKGETFGLSPLEAMSFGCATIVSNLDCFKDFIKNNHNGLIFNHRKNKVSNLFNKICFLKKNKSFFSKISYNAKKVNYTHSIIKIGNELLRDFNYIVNQNKHENSFTKK